MRFLVSFVFFLCGLSGFAQAQQMRTAQIMDNQGFGVPMVAYSIDVPTDWSVRGEVVWTKPCSSGDYYELVLELNSPDGLTGFRVQPGHKIIWNDIIVSGLDPQLAQMLVAQTVAERNKLESQLRGTNCHVVQITSADQLFNGVISRPQGMQIVSTKPNEPMRKQYQATFTSAPGMKVFFDASLVEMTYPVAGRQVSETLSFSWYMFQLEPLDPSFGTFMQTTTIEPLRSVRMAADRRAQDDELLEKILGSFRADAAWQEKMNAFHRKIAQQQAAASQQRRQDNELAWQQHQVDVAIRDIRSDINHLQFLDMLRQ